MTETQPFTAPSSGWHVAPDDLRSYVAGRVHGVSADSIEAHLLRCDRCRATLTDTASRDVRDLRWEAIALEIDQPGRWARSATWFRVAVGTPHLAMAAAVLAAIFIAVPLIASLANERTTVTWFVALAPAVPIAAAVVAYATAADPAGNTGAATPLHSFRLVVLRTAILLAVVLPIGLLASVLLPVPTALVLGWFLPAVAVCALVLAIGTRYDPMWVAGSLAAGWAAFVLGGFARMRQVPLTDALEQLSVNQPVVQIGSAIVTAAAGVWFVVRRGDVTYRVSP
jgi:hypothetical protein